jgi:hypothetical protein
MAFCSSCGGQLEGNERFCVKCGADQSAKAGGAPAVQPPPPQAPPPQAAYPPQPYPAMPPQYPPPHGQIPIMMPPPAPAKSNKGLLIVIVVAAVLGGGYYYNQHYQQNPAPTPAPQTQPTPQTQPGPQTPPAAPAPAGNNQALVAQQQLACRWQAVNGNIVITQAQWTNSSTVAIQAASMEIQQVAAAGQIVAQNQTTLTGPVQPGQTQTFNTIQMGAAAQGVTQVNCGIVGVTPAN